jgi:hypothetical protein
VHRAFIQCALGQAQPPTSVGTQRCLHPETPKGGAARKLPRRLLAHHLLGPLQMGSVSAVAAAAAAPPAAAAAADSAAGGLPPSPPRAVRLQAQTRPAPAAAPLGCLLLG